MLRGFFSSPGSWLLRVVVRNSCTIDSLQTFCKKKKIPQWTGRQFGTHQTLAFTCCRSVDTHMHKSKQLADCDSTPNVDKITMYDKGYIVSKKRFSYLFKTYNWKDNFVEHIGNGCSQKTQVSTVDAWNDLFGLWEWLAPNEPLG